MVYLTIFLLFYLIFLYYIFLEDFSTANEDSLQWLHFDDAHLKLLSNSEFNSKIIDNNFDSPYILFYVKEDSI